ncbi:MAG: 23S rRNA (pseudouridine1915-N3)-methyltransferase [Cellvibrionaceae bacterium]|jgi:23S rRNA (pseudouridine1915-N3)-methyltransferase
MHLRVLAVGNRMPSWVQQGILDYQKRFPREWGFQWVELPLGMRTKSGNPAKAIESESKAMLAAIQEREYVIALDINGKSWSTASLSQKMQQWQTQGLNVCLLIGGPDGLSTRCLQRANLCWSLSALTLPHPVVRVVLSEQLYRSWTILNHHPYHR